MRCRPFLRALLSSTFRLASSWLHHGCLPGLLVALFIYRVEFIAACCITCIIVWACMSTVQSLMYAFHSPRLCVNFAQSAFLMLYLRISVVPVSLQSHIRLYINRLWSLSVTSLIDQLMTWRFNRVAHQDGPKLLYEARYQYVVFKIC